MSYELHFQLRLGRVGLGRVAINEGDEGDESNEGDEGGDESKEGNESNTEGNGSG